jgi:hypothetical protein
MRRELIPVRLTIHSSLTPSRAAIGPFPTALSGKLVPTDATAAPRAVRNGPIALRAANGASAVVGPIIASR